MSDRVNFIDLFEMIYTKIDFLLIDNVSRYQSF